MQLVTLKSYIRIYSKHNFSFLGSGPNRGQCPVEWGYFPYIHTSVHTSPPLGHPASSEAHPARPEAQPARLEAQPARPGAKPGFRLQPWLAGFQAWLDGSEGVTDGQAGGCRENLPILQDFAPYRGCCPASQRPIKRSRAREPLTI